MITLPEGMPVLAICGYRDAGKTTLIEAVLPELARRGLRVAVIKHDTHGLQVDRPGKDSARLFGAGADVWLHGPGEGFLRVHESAPAGLHRALEYLVSRYDLILVEGHKDTPLPRIWLPGPNGTDPPPGPAPLAVLPRDDHRPRRLMDFLAEWLPAQWRSAPLYGCILIGGRSRRMGRPKQLLTRGGKSWAEHLAAVLGSACRRVVFAGSGPLPPALDEHPRLPDCPDAQGPLAGILAAMRWAPQASWLVCACDTPGFHEDALQWLLAQRRPGRWAILPRLPGAAGVEPLGAYYDLRLRPILETQAQSKRWRLHDLTELPKVETPCVPEALAAAWRNLNHPEDLPEESKGSSNQRGNQRGQSI